MILKKCKYVIILIWVLIASCKERLAYGLQQPNILFIAIDDLRPELGCYGSSIAKSPQLDRLAHEGVLFENAYCQQAICGPSRASVLTGLRPATTGIVHNYLKIREQNPEVVTLPQFFKNKGYETIYMGKIFHHGDKDDDLSWSRMADTSLIEPPVKLYAGYALKANQQAKRKNTQDIIAKYGRGKAIRGLGSSGPAFESADVPDRTYIDGYHTELAVAELKQMSKSDKPFFLGLGFNRPHLNWVAPEKYWNLYSRDSIKLSNQKHPPKNGAAVGLHASFELRVRHNIPKSGEIDDSLALTLKHAYLACISYVDAQIGKVIQALDDTGLRENTIIVVWSDHGWHLGDMGVWGKATNYEIATRVPLLIWTPDFLDKSRGKKTKALVELVDLYPTLVDLAGFDVSKKLGGKSLVPILKQEGADWNSVAFSQFPSPALREWGAFPLSDGMKDTYFGPLINIAEVQIQAQFQKEWNRELFENHLMGYAMRTKRYRLVLWKDLRFPNNDPLFVELYDHKNDPNETINISLEKPEIVNNLIARFDQEWGKVHLNN